MKAIITLSQCKRVVLPHIFTRYCYPIMKDIFPGEMELYLIQHVGGFSNHHTPLKTAKINNSRLQLVQQWTDEGMYEGANIIQHTECWPNYPHMPSIRYGVELAIKNNSDFHIWLEDDALLLDENCNTWDRIENGYIATCTHSKIVNVAYLLTTLGFDKKILPLVSDKSIWKLGGSNYNRDGSLKDCRVEARLAKEAGDKRVLLNAKSARMHKSCPKRIKRLQELIEYVAPGKSKLLNIDFEEVNN